MSTTTRERIVDEAMHLFSQHGYSGTSIAKIEAAAGLTPGAGGIYHHFPSKEAVLAAGIERQLSRLGALREIRNVLGSLGDLKAELTLTARYVLAELDSESELLRILASDRRRRATRELDVHGLCRVDRRTLRACDRIRGGERDSRLRARLAALHTPAARRPRPPGPGR
jgi:AcrR family transcriptional regulator